MPQSLSLSKAARLIGLSRATLQRKIKNGELDSFDGMVQPEDLLRAFPDFEIEADPEYERVKVIKEQAFGKRVFERALPDKEVLAARLNSLGRELSDAQAKLQHYRTLIENLGRKLSALAATGGERLASDISALQSWLSGELEGQAEGFPHAILVKESLMRIMSPQVRLVPSGHEFFVEGSDTILEAALHAGIALDYACSNGNCGECKARIVSGQVKKIHPHDFHISEAEQGRGYVLLCSNTAVTDLVIEASVAGSVAEIPLQHITAKVKGVDALGDDIRLLKVQTPRSSRLRFFAGQSVTLSFGRGVEGAFPVASCPCDDRNLQFHVRRQAGNRFAEYVFDQLRGGEEVALEGPLGDFVLREESPRIPLFLAFDSGFAPIKSLIEHAMAVDNAESLHLYWLASRPEELYMTNICRAWADALDNFTFTALVADRDGIAGQMRQVVLAFPDLAKFDVYVAGPNAQTAEAKSILLQQGLPPEQLFLSESANFFIY
ncbi:MAG: 2Fe-2S iron-sulfur cluster binding domain-containing protein [Sulfuricellaceae bacterium]|nr:2Fe-2S iron-sulfur cluster binding domain-containing protein [Sulfuricellaceae bacterium]